MDEETENLLIDALFAIKDPKGATFQMITKYLSTKGLKIDEDKEKKLRKLLSDLVKANKLKKPNNARWKIDENYAPSLKRKQSEVILPSPKKQKMEVDQDEIPNNSFANLPREISEEIFSYLDVGDLGRLLIVSKGVNQLAKSKKFWRKLEIKTEDINKTISLMKISSSNLEELIVLTSIQVEPILKALQEISPIHLRKLHIENTVGRQAQFYKEWNKLLPYFQKLEELSFPRYIDWKVTSELPELRNLTVSSLRCIIDTKLFPKLQYLCIRSASFNYIDLMKIPLKGLSLISFDFRSKLNPSGYETLELDLPNSNRLSNTSFQELLTNNKNLRALLACASSECNDLKNVPLESLMLRFDSCPSVLSLQSEKLKKLKLESSFGNESKMKIDCPNLNILWLERVSFNNYDEILSNCPKITHFLGQSLYKSSIYQSLPILENLKELELRGCMMSQEVMNSIAKCKNLQKIKIYGSNTPECVSVTLDMENLDELKLHSFFLSQVLIRSFAMETLELWTQEKKFSINGDKENKYQCPKLKRFKFGDSAHYEPIFAAESLSSMHLWAANLEEIILASIQLEETVKLNLQKLKYLKVKIKKGVEMLFIDCPQLKKLSFQKTENLTSIIFPQFSCPSLTYLNISDTSVDSKVFELIAKQFPDIKELKATSIRMDENWIDEFCKHLGRKIENLRFGPKSKKINTLAPEQLLKIASESKVLQYFELRSALAINDSTLRVFVSLCKQLKRIRVSDCKSISMGCLKKIANEFPVEVEQVTQTELQSKKKKEKKIEIRNIETMFLSDFRACPQQHTCNPKYY